MDYVNYRHMKQFIFLALMFSVIEVAVAKDRDTLAISFESEGYVLTGKLLLPKEVREPIPAVIFLVGSGGNSSYASDYRKFLEFFLLDPFAGEQVAFLFFDKRGVGGSEGKWFRTDFHQRALDAKNAAVLLQDHPAIDPQKIYLVGHSQGGWIVQLCLSDYPTFFAGGVSMAGPTFGVKQQLVNDYQSSLICNEGLEPEEARKKASRRVNRDLAVVSLLPLEDNWKQLKVIRRFDPESSISQIRKPVLFLFAENDRLVNPGWSMERLSEIFPNGHPTCVDTYIATGENHQFQTSPLCFKGKWSDLKYSDQTREHMVAWLEKQLAIQ